MAKTPALDHCGTDLTELARQGKLDLAIGRQHEMERAVQVLCRQTKNNPVLLGEPDAMPMVVVEGLAHFLAGGDVPEPLRERRLISFNLTSLTGTLERATFEPRLLAMLDDVRKDKSVILSLDNFHFWGQVDPALFHLAIALNSSQVQCIASTTAAEFDKLVAREFTLDECFVRIPIAPLDSAEAVVYLRCLRSRYEAHHNVWIQDDALDAAVELSNRHVREGCLPGKAIDLLDEACAQVRLKSGAQPAALRQLEAEIQAIKMAQEAAVAETDFDKAVKFRDQGLQLQQKKAELTAAWSEESRGTVDEEAVALALSKVAGIPLATIRQ